MPGEPCWGNLGGTLGNTFLKDFLRDAGGTWMPGMPDAGGTSGGAEQGPNSPT